MSTVNANTKYFFHLQLFLILFLFSCSVVKTDCVDDSLDVEIKEVLAFDNSVAHVEGKEIDPFKVYLQPVILDFASVSVLDRKYVDFLKSVEIANQKFQGILNFKRASEIYYIAENDKTMQDLRNMNLKSRLAWSEQFQEEGMLTVFIVPGKEGLNGFVNRYSVPDWNCDESETILSYLYISADAISNHRTLTHELGHIFGLDHCLCCSKGLGEDEECWFNVMNQVFSPCRTELSEEQLNTVWNYLPYVNCFIH